MTDHSVWGGAAPPWEPTAYADGAPSIRTASAFYSTAITWYVVGARVRAPAGSNLGTVTLSLRLALNATLVDLSTAPVASGQVAVGAGAGWYDVTWTGIELTAPDAAWISLDSADGLRYVHVPSASVGANPVQAADGANLYLAEALHPRSAFRSGTDPTLTGQGAWYGLDIIVSDTPPVPPETLPTTGTIEPVAIPAHDIVATTPVRGLTALTPARALEIP